MSQHVIKAVRCFPTVYLSEGHTSAPHSHYNWVGFTIKFLVLLNERGPWQNLLNERGPKFWLGSRLGTTYFWWSHQILCSRLKTSFTLVVPHGTMLTIPPPRLTKSTISPHCILLGLGLKSWKNITPKITMSTISPPSALGGEIVNMVPHMYYSLAIRNV